MPRSAGHASKWSSDEFLNGLRDKGDPLADACAAALPPDQRLAFLFTKMRTDAALPADVPFVEMPLFAACGNIAWEFVWGFVHAPDVGFAVWRCYQVWFLLDIYIFWAVLKYGSDQFPAPLRRWFVPTCLVGAILWGIGIHTMIISGIDTPIGAVSAYIDNLGIAVLYVILFLRLPSGVGQFSWPVAWMKMLGTGLNTIFMNMHYPDNYFLRFLAITTTAIDCFYIWLFWRRRRLAVA